MSRAPTPPAEVDILIPTFNRPAALAVTLTSVMAQTVRALRVVIADQSDEPVWQQSGELRAIVNVLQAQGREVELHGPRPRRGLAEQRQFLLDQAKAPYALFLDDDVILEPDLVARMLAALQDARCGFVGSAVHGLSFKDDERPHQQTVTWWEGPVQPEAIAPGGPQWARHHLHSAANLHHLQQRLSAPWPHSRGPSRLYKVAWIGGCVLFDTARLRAAGGFDFWEALPAAHCGEDVLAQLRVMARDGGCGLFPSGAYHQELPTTVPDRQCDAPWALQATLP
ncbi:glycosyltransferase family 2 protein [uncultured Aquabacterium sp.]|jgi:GT2 family glycosyltransferase|uniref:glycosyltransferase n=1 Tax=uncultured Aquabacterium sp. TaxID=158753 RepID=UPI002626AC20|nr:glycosyltransferase family 2 protein [uncultured Aquabacterium sp.]